MAAVAGAELEGVLVSKIGPGGSSAGATPNGTTGNVVTNAIKGLVNGSTDKNPELTADEKAKAKYNASKDSYNELIKTFGNQKAAKDFVDSYGLGPKTDDDRAKSAAEAKADKAAKGKAAGKALLDAQDVDSTITDRTPSWYGLATRPAGYGASYIQDDWSIKAIAGVDNPAALNDEAWRIVCQSSGLLRGFKIDTAGPGYSTLSRARRPAFQIKNVPKPDTTTNPNSTTSTTTNVTANTNPTTGTSTNPGTSVNVTVNNIPMNATYGRYGRIPDYEVYDNASIDVVETFSDDELAAAEGGFSTWSVKSSMSGGFAGFSGAGSASYSEQHQSANSRNISTQKRSYTARYTFPRARVFLDGFDLELTDHCKVRVDDILAAIVPIQNNVNAGVNADTNQAVRNALQLLRKFENDYGVGFATEVELGGQLYATKSAESFGDTITSKNQDAMKWEAAASFGTPWTQNDVSGGQDRQSVHEDVNKSVRNNSGLTWSARGGNTLLVADPPEWANSLASFSTWRTMNLNGLRYLVELIGEICDANGKNFLYPGIKDNFDYIRKAAFNLQGAKWSGRFSMETADRKYKLINEDNWVRLVPRADPRPALVFTALDADISKKDDPFPLMKKLPADYPLFLVTNQGVARDPPDRGSQFSGIWTNQDGFVGVSGGVGTPFRWSFRPSNQRPNFKDRWSPNAYTIKDGDTVRMFCHSLGCGSYRDINDPPYFAPQLLMGNMGADSRQNALKIPKLSSNIMRRCYNLTKPECGQAFNLNDSDVRDAMIQYDCLMASPDQEKVINGIRPFYGFADVKNPLLKNVDPAKIDPIRPLLAYHLNAWQTANDFAMYLEWMSNKWEGGVVNVDGNDVLPAVHETNKYEIDLRINFED